MATPFCKVMATPSTPFHNSGKRNRLRDHRKTPRAAEKGLRVSRFHLHAVVEGSREVEGSLFRRCGRKPRGGGLTFPLLWKGGRGPHLVRSAAPLHECRDAPSPRNSRGHCAGVTVGRPANSEWWPGRRGFGFDGFDAFIRHRGGIVRRSELLAAGWTPDELRIAFGLWGRPERVRRGWYCVPELPDEIRRAWAAGGPLACISAVRWHQGEPLGELLHIAMHDHRHTRRREREARRASVVVHWHDPADAPDNAWALPLGVALHQASRCAGALADEARLREQRLRRARHCRRDGAA